MDKPTFEAQLYEHAHRLLKTHETLLRDAVRNQVFYEALKASVTGDSVVLDIGAGTGIWAVAAAKMGAKRVVAIDTDEMLTGVIKMLAVEHGVADRVEAIWGNSFDIQLEREFDIVVSETIGYFGYDENIVSIMHDARTRFLKDDGLIIPETLSLHAAAGHLKTCSETVPAGLPFDLDGLRRLNLHSPRVLKKPDDVQLLTPPQCLVQTDLRNTAETPSLENMRAAWQIDDAAAINCFVLWVESRLASGVSLSTRDTTSWLPYLYRIEPVDGAFSHVELDLSLTPVSSCWNATFSNENEQVSKRYSPEIAATEMIVSARNDGLVTDRDGRIFLDYLRAADRDIELRPATDGDDDFLYAVYCGTRGDEVARFGWSEAEQSAFLRMQFATRQRAYKMQVPDAESSVILFGGTPVGSIIIDRKPENIALTDIAILPQYRKNGIATHLIKQLQDEAAASGRPLVLHVDKINLTAQKLYEKAGFTVTAETELTNEMEWVPVRG